MYIRKKGRAAGRVGSGQTFCRQSPVGSGRVNVSPGRVGSEKNDPWTTLEPLFDSCSLAAFGLSNLVYIIP